MKRASKKLLIAAALVLLTAMMFLTMPLSVMAKSTVTRPTALTVTANGVTIDPADADYEERQVYEMEFWANGSDFSSFAFSFRMPAFVQVQDVMLDSALDGLDNTVFSWHEKDGLVNTTYSSSDNVSGVRLFTVRFTVKDYSFAYCAVECVSADFVNVDLNTVEVSADLGFVQIGEVSFTTMGDVDGNGTVDLADLLIIQRSMVNPDYALNEAQFAVADIDKNGVITILDCQYIQNYLVGRIDSLENIGGGGEIKMYTVKVVVMDENGNVLVDMPASVGEGESYYVATAPAMQALNARYEVLEFVSARSDYYGEINFDVSGEEYPVKCDDQLTVVVKVVEKERAVQYTFAAEMKMEDDTVRLLNYAFYTDGTALFKMEMIQGDKIVDSAEQAVQWLQDGQYIDVIIPEMGLQRMFVINKDGTLSAYEGNQPEPDVPSDDYVVRTSWDVQVGVVVGTSSEELVARLCKHTFTIVFSQSGEFTVPITPDMINYANVNLNEVGEYEVEIHYSVNGHGGTIWVDVYVIEDKSKVEILGVYDFPEGKDMMGVSTITVYADGTLQLGEVYQTKYQEFKDNVVIFSLYGGDFVISLDDATKAASYYKPTEEMIGRYVYDMGGGTMFFEVYGKYDGAGDYVTVYGVDAGDYQISMTTRAYLDLGERVLRHAATPCDMTFDENNILTENHQIEIRTEEPGCDRYGYEIEYCVKCGRTVNRTEIPPIGHQYGEDGNCVNCGKSEQGDFELENRRNEMLKEMENKWQHLWDQYGENLSAFEGQYDKYYNAVANARDMGTLEEYFNYFWKMVEEVHNKLGGMTQIYVSGWYYLNGIPTSVVQGGSVEQYIKDYLIGNTLTLELSDGTTVPVIIEENMIGVNGSFDAVGYCWIYIHVAVGDINHTCDISINVTPDMSGVASKVYRYTEAFNGWDIITVYENDMLEIFGQYYSYMVLSADDAVTVIRFHGNSFYGESVLALNHKDLTASFYQPDGNVVGRYTLQEGDNEFIYTLYGESAVSGDFVVVVQRKLGDGQGNFKQEDQYTTALYCNFEECFINTADYGMLSFDEAGNLYRKEIVEPEKPNDPTQQFEQFRDQVKDQIKMLWSEIEQGNWEVSDEQYAQYNSIMERIYQASENWQIDELYQEAKDLCNTIKGIVELRYWGTTGIPHTVLAGITMEEFYEMLNSAKLYMVYSDGTEVEIALSAEMFNLKRLELSKPGEYDISWSYQPEGLEYALNGMPRVEVIENMGEGEGVEYSYIPFTEGAINAMEWDTITLYKNGYALLRDDYGMSFVEYVLDGDMLTYTYYGVVGLFQIVKDEAGNAIGISYYRPEKADRELLYDDGEDMYIRLETFVLNGRDYAFFDLREYNRDGSQDMYEMAGDILFNADTTKVYLALFGGCWFEISEKNELIPCECEHLYEEDGCCRYCGDNINGDGEIKDDYVENGGYTESEKENVTGGEGNTYATVAVNA